MVASTGGSVHKQVRRQDSPPYNHAERPWCTNAWNHVNAFSHAAAEFGQAPPLEPPAPPPPPVHPPRLSLDTIRPAMHSLPVRMSDSHLFRGTTTTHTLSALLSSCGDRAVMGAVADMVARSPSFNGSPRTSSLISGFYNREGTASPLSHKRSGSSSLLKEGLLLYTQSGSRLQASTLLARRSASGPAPPFGATPEDMSVRLPLLLPFSANNHARRSVSAPVPPFAANPEGVSLLQPLMPFSTHNHGRDGTIPPAAVPAAGQVA